MRRNFAEFSSETKVRNLLAEIREFRRISAKFGLISFAQQDPRSTLSNWLLNRQFENKNSQSLKRPDKCVQSETVVPLSPQNENKVKSNVSPWLATVTTITANGGIITSSGSSLHRGTQQEYSSKPLKLNIALLNVFLISVYMVDIGICLSPNNFSSVRIP